MNLSSDGLVQFSYGLCYQSISSEQMVWLPIWNKLITAGKDILDVLYKCMMFINY